MIIKLYKINLVKKIVAFYKNINNYFNFLQGYTNEGLSYGPDCGINTILNIITDIYDFKNKKIKGTLSMHPLLNDYLKDYSSKEEMIKSISHQKRIEFDLLVYKINSNNLDCFIKNKNDKPDDVIISLKTLYTVFSNLFMYVNPELEPDLSIIDYGKKIRDMFMNINERVKFQYYNETDLINIMIEFTINKNKYNFQKIHSFQDNVDTNFFIDAIQNFSMNVSESELEFNNLSLIFMYALMYGYSLDLFITQNTYEEPIIANNFIGNIINNKKILGSIATLQNHPFITNNILYKFLV